MSLLKMGLDNYPTNSNDYTCITSHGRVFNFNENELRYDLIGQLTYDNTPIHELYNCVKFGNRILCTVKRLPSSSAQVFLFDTTAYNNQQYITSIYAGHATVDNEYLYSTRSDRRYIDKWYLDPSDNTMKIHSSSNYLSNNFNNFIYVDSSSIISTVSTMIKFVNKKTLRETYSKSISVGLRPYWINYSDYVVYSVALDTTNQIGKFVKPGTDNPSPIGTTTILDSSSGSENTNRRYICHIWKDILLYRDANHDIGIYDLKNSTNIQSPSSINRVIVNWEQMTYNFDNFIINGNLPDTAYNVNPFGVYGSITSTTPFNSDEIIQCMWKN